jgi:hypothetical protein
MGHNGDVPLQLNAPMPASGHWNRAVARLEIKNESPLSLAFASAGAAGTGFVVHAAAGDVGLRPHHHSQLHDHHRSQRRPSRRDHRDLRGVPWIAAPVERPDFALLQGHREQCARSHIDADARESAVRISADRLFELAAGAAGVQTRNGTGTKSAQIAATGEAASIDRGAPFTPGSLAPSQGCVINRG